MRCCVFIILFFSIINCIYSQSGIDTLSLSVKDAEAKFLEKNLILLAQKYNIDISKAQTLQARVWENPTIDIEQNAYNWYTKKFFDIGYNGETAVGIDQLISLAGKRNKRILLSNVNSEIVEYQFYDLLRTLKYQLHTCMNDLFYLQRSVKIFDKEILSLQKVVDQYNVQLEKGNVSLKEATRLKAELFSLENDRMDVVDSINYKIGTIRLLIHDSTAVYIKPQIEADKIQNVSMKEIEFSKLQKQARENRFDLKVSESQIKYQEVNLAYQKSMAVPDIHLTGRYDHAGSYINDYFALGFAIDLPVWNRNKGNKQVAKCQLDQSKIQYLQYMSQVDNDILYAKVHAEQLEKRFKNLDKKFISDLEILIDGIITNYEKRNISLLEFLDYYQTYKESMMDLNRLQNNYMNAIEQLNYVTGKEIL